MKSNGSLRKFATAFAIMNLAIGTVCLGLGGSVSNYINYEHDHSHQVPVSTVHECATYFIVGAVFCLAGIVLWLFGKRPAV